jgi:esterase/lipase superfamily enzyme
MSKWRLYLGIIFFVALALIAVVATYAIRNFTGLGPVPTRSAFTGRLPGIQEGDKRRFQFYYATNRADSDETFNGYGNELGEEILTGTFDVRISPYMTVQPFEWFDTKSMEWGGRRELPKDAFRIQLQGAVQNSPKKSLLIIVWGFRDWFTSAALKTAYTAYVLDIDTPVLLFDWPGNQGEGFRGYAASQLVATQSAPDLGRILTSAIKDTGAENIWLMGSSLGCQTICDSFAWLATQPHLLQTKPKIAQVVLSAPDVSADAFDEKFAERIKALSRHLTAYVSSNDRALLMSHWLNRSRRLGRKAQVLVPPENRTGEYEFEEALELLELQQKGFKNLSVVDATPINSLRNLHHFFTDSSIFFDDLYQRLQQPEDIVSRRLHSVRTGPQGATYWILWND